MSSAPRSPGGPTSSAATSPSRPVWTRLAAPSITPASADADNAAVPVILPDAEGAVSATGRGASDTSSSRMPTAGPPRDGYLYDLEVQPVAVAGDFSTAITKV